MKIFDTAIPLECYDQGLRPSRLPAVGRSRLPARASTWARRAMWVRIPSEAERPIRVMADTDSCVVAEQANTRRTSEMGDSVNFRKTPLMAPIGPLDEAMVPLGADQPERAGETAHGQHSQEAASDQRRRLQAAGLESASPGRMASSKPTTS
jgi:hypothetical protein